MFARLEEFRFARWVKGLNRWTQILLSLALVGALNYLAARHFLRWDLTADHRYTLSSETISYLDQKVRQSLTGSLQIVQILPDDQSDTNRITTENIRRLGKEYDDAAKHRLTSGPIGNLSYKEVDPLLDRETFTGYLKMGMPNTTRVLVRSGSDETGWRFRALNNGELYKTQGKNDPVFNGENAVTSAILDVTQKEADEIYFTTGHGESNLDSTDPLTGLSELKEFLRGRHFTLKPLDITGDNEIPKTAKVVVVIKPINKFDPVEIQKLRQNPHHKHGRLMVLLEPDEDSGLDGLLHDWGLRSPNSLVVREIDPRFTTADHNLIVKPESTTKEPHELVRFLALADSPLNLTFGRVRPVVQDTTASTDERRQVSELIFSSKKSLLLKTPVPDVLDLTKKLDAWQDSYSLAALAERRASDAVKLDGGRLLVVGCADFVNNSYLRKSANAQFILKCFEYLTNHENQLNIQPHLAMQADLEFESAQLTGLAWRLSLVPALVALFGLIVFWLRNRS